jgi:hypothetical protein
LGIGCQTEASLTRDLRLQRDCQRLCELGPRAVFELLAEIGRAHLIRTDIEQRAAAFAAIDPDLLEALGGRSFPPRVFLARSIAA